jgi:mono/diheme cytochrome c family protein
MRKTGQGFLIAITALCCAKAPAAIPASFFEARCFACHNAGLKSGSVDIEALVSGGMTEESRETWQTVAHKLNAGEMPPPGLPRPPQDEVKQAAQWIADEIARLDSLIEPDPGRVTARRLNRAEYNNTVRDLLGVDLRPADDFPADDSGYGFDNIADALSLSPVLMERYLTAAEQVVRAALFGLPAMQPTVVRHQPPYRFGADGGDNKRFLEDLEYSIDDYDVTGLSHASALHAAHTFPASGIYEFRISPDGNRPRPSDPFEGILWVDGKQRASIQLTASYSATGMEGEDQQVRVWIEGGPHEIAVAVPRIYEGLPARYGGLNPTKKPMPEPDELKPPAGATPEEIAQFKAFAERRRAREDGPGQISDVSFRFNFVEISGPFEQELGPTAESLAKIFPCGHAPGEHEPSCAREALTKFARRAFRRPATATEIERLTGLFDQAVSRGNTFEESIAVGLQAVLVSPQFLFRVENDPPTGQERRLSDFELASRLSYFLWSTMPDEELLSLAEQGQLSDKATLHKQVQRMIQDPKAAALAENFGGQWLQFRALESAEPDKALFSRFDHYLSWSMEQETKLLFEHIMRDDKSVLDFVNAKYSYLNEDLARFYGIPGVRGPAFRKVDLSGTQRGGVLTQGSVLTVSSYATRTSPVLRGKWVLENLLNQPPPPPPPDVPALDESKTGKEMSMRAQMEAHRANAVCASCHARMDPLGFGLENFDAIGRWRTHEGDFEIDAAGKLPDGSTFAGPRELADLLAKQDEAFGLAISEKLLIYALGRGLKPHDRPVLKNIAEQLKADDYRFSSLVLGIVDSLPFQYRKAEENL